MVGLRIAVITSCTGAKQYKPSNQLTKDDFYQSKEHLRLREEELYEYQLPASKMYTGDQHTRLILGLNKLDNVDTYIVSAGYGVINLNTPIVPYECTFSDMNKKELLDWSNTISIPKDIDNIIKQSNYDLIIVLLGNSYLKAIQLSNDSVFGSPTLFFCSNDSYKYILGKGKIYTIKLSNLEAKRFKCALVGLKGELCRRLLNVISNQNTIPNMDCLLEILDKEYFINKKTPSTLIPLKKVNYIFPKEVIPKSNGLMYYLPDWGDMVDLEYDFLGESHSSGRGGWVNEVYAHQIYKKPSYNGILLSRACFDEKSSKYETVKNIGVHNYMRVPNEFPIMGDSGAFSYIDQDEPIYNTNEMLDYYTDLGYNFGVSIDHLWFGGKKESDKKYRYDLTISNAEEFIKEHRKRQLNWTPIGAIQGWDVPTYTKASIDLVNMGYEYLGLGGVVHTKSKKIVDILESIRSSVPNEIKIHVFGVSRPEIISEYKRLSVTSADSASPLRKAFTDIKKGYYTLEGAYSAIKIPSVKGYLKNIDKDKQSLCVRLEYEALNCLRNYDKGLDNLDNTLNALLSYDRIFRKNNLNVEPLYKNTLENRVWKLCTCDICKSIGVDVIMFRGRNRNQRRGFHNTYIIYSLINNILLGESVSKFWIKNK